MYLNLRNKLQNHPIINEIKSKNTLLLKINKLTQFGLLKRGNVQLRQHSERTANKSEYLKEEQ